MQTGTRAAEHGRRLTELANAMEAASTGGVRVCLGRVAGCATPRRSAGHAGATANLKLTFHLDHSAGADQVNSVGAQIAAKISSAPFTKIKDWSRS